MSWSHLVRKSILIALGFSFVLPRAAEAMGEDIIRNYVSRQVAVPLIKPSWGNFIIHTEPLNKLYSLRSYSAIWVDDNGKPNVMFDSLKAVFMAADRQGLDASDYWDSELQSLYDKVQRNNQNWITFELASSEALVRYVSHLSTGRFDPELVDSDIKYKKRNFSEFNELAAAVANGPVSLQVNLDQLAPLHERYQSLVQGLAQLRSIKAQGGWSTTASPGFALKLGVKDPVIVQLRNRLNQMGYAVSMVGGENFDAEFEKVLIQYQAANGLMADGIIGTRSEVLRSLNYNVHQRISRIEVTMEKLRWLPRVLESRHIMVNLATTEFRLWDEGKQVFYFKTINGQPFRRTPSMRDAITFVNLNPTWTVPHSIAIRDKIPALRKDSQYLEKNNMVLLDASTDERVDSSLIDWSRASARNFPYYIRQMPGPDNALGVVKFPLQNPWAIYMHDTNEKQLFADGKRHRSSGCVRLEQPLELAAYLLQDQPGWDINTIRNFVPMSAYDRRVVETERRVNLKKAMPVYFVYLTAEKNADGRIRFVEDVYGQDYRLQKALENKRNGNETF